MDSCGPKRKYQEIGLKTINYHLSYDTGRLFWVNPLSNRVKPCQEAGWVKSSGYRVVSLNKRVVPTHHLVWCIFNGDFIEAGKDIDHVNGNKLDNRIENLRVATRSENLLNKRPYGKTSPYKGVYQHTSGRFYARFREDYLGIYDTAEEAALVWNRAARLSDDYGPFYRLNTLPRSWVDE